jgi:glutamyl-tRNA synthetase
MDTDSTPRGITRLAPSPTGALHLGNARTFVINALLARRQGWRVLMRMEDLDGPRVKPGADETALADLLWLGLAWEKPIVYQSARHERYREALDWLVQAGWAYPCICTRKDVEHAASAPAAEDGSVSYPGSCRGRFPDAEAALAASGRPCAWRIRVPDEPIDFGDGFSGPQRVDLARRGGDFVIFRREGLAAYQLAVVLDDHTAGVDAIVRGDDLLESAARQLHLYRVLGLVARPRYWHLPLVIGPDGRKLAKRHGDTRLEHYRRKGTPAPRVLGLLGYWSGLLETRREADLDELADRFDLGRLPREPVVFTPADEAWLDA